MWLFPLVALPLTGLFFLWALGMFPGKEDFDFNWIRRYWYIYPVAFFVGLALAFVIWR